MKVKILYVIADTKFGKSIVDWAVNKQIEVVVTEQKNNDLIELVDGVILFHENHNFTKEDAETQNVLANNNRAVHKVDINGTLSATNSNFSMWLERNRPNHPLFLGAEEIVKNENLAKFLSSLED